MEWKPIETAPKETDVLICDGNIQCVARFEIWWIGHKGSWECIGSDGYDSKNTFKEPTHWMPLPIPPK